jgi:hypothetical protein
MDISGMFNEASPNSDGSETANVDASASSSPVVDVNSLLGDDTSGTASASTDDSTATPSDDQSTVSLDPLDVIVPIETIVYQNDEDNFLKLWCFLITNDLADIQYLFFASNINFIQSSISW